MGGKELDLGRNRKAFGIRAVSVFLLQLIFPSSSLSNVR